MKLLSSGLGVYNTFRTVPPPETCVRKACLLLDGIPPSSPMDIQSGVRKSCLQLLYGLVLAFALIRIYAGGLTGSEKAVKLVFNLHFDSS